MQKQIEELTRTVAALSAGDFRGRSRCSCDRDYGTSHHRSQSRRRSRSRPRNRELCWYHDRFGAKAKKCEPDCKCLEDHRMTSGYGRRRRMIPVSFDVRTSFGADIPPTCGCDPHARDHHLDTGITHHYAGWYNKSLRIKLPNAVTLFNFKFTKFIVLIAIS
ncbi:hypothetical protein ACJJTC_007142 [Scirpophaga incertulas]